MSEAGGEDVVGLKRDCEQIRFKLSVVYVGELCGWRCSGVEGCELHLVTRPLQCAHHWAPCTPAGLSYQPFSPSAPESVFKPTQLVKNSVPLKLNIMLQVKTQWPPIHHRLRYLMLFLLMRRRLE